MQTRYGYFRIPVLNSQRDGVICVRLDCPEKGYPLNYKAVLCFCSPKDTFSKKLAHKILGSRLSPGAHGDLRNQNVIKLTYAGDEKPPRSDQIMRDALSQAFRMKRITKRGFHKPFIPNWAMKRLSVLTDGTIVTKDYENSGTMALELGMKGGQ